MWWSSIPGRYVLLSKLWQQDPFVSFHMNAYLFAAPVVEQQFDVSIQPPVDALPSTVIGLPWYFQQTVYNNGPSLHYIRSFNWLFTRQSLDFTAYGAGLYGWCQSGGGPPSQEGFLMYGNFGAGPQTLTVGVPQMTVNFDLYAADLAVIAP